MFGVADHNTVGGGAGGGGNGVDFINVSMVLGKAPEAGETIMGQPRYVWHRASFLSGGQHLQ